MELAHIPFTDLKVSPLNMRHGRKAPPLDDLLPSIRARGVLEPLLVRKAGKAYEIVAGRRRYFALKTLAKEGATPGDVPCAVLAESDDAAALEASLLENTARLAPDDMTRYESFAKLVAKGKDVDEIAATFGVSAAAVRRALALGGLIPAIRNAFRKGEIDTATLRQLTLASEAQQRDWWALVQDPAAYAPMGRALKQWLFGAEIRTDVALFPLEEYPGRIVADLFDEHGLFEDADAFWRLQHAVIAETREALLAKGWPEVRILETGIRFWAWDHAAVSKKDGGRVYLEVAESGQVTIHKGYLSHAELRRRSAKDAPEEAPAPKPELSQPAQTYVALHRHAAIRRDLLAAPKIALRLMLAHAIAGSALWRTDVEPQRAGKPEIAASVAAHPAEAAFKAERQAVLKLLGEPEDRRSVTLSTGDPYRTGVLFTRLCEKTDDEVLRCLAFVMAETLQAGTCVVELLAHVLDSDPGRDWTPDATFFDLLRDKPVLTEMIAELAGAEAAEANRSATAKAQKAVIADALAGRNGRTAIPDWTPGYFRRVIATYTDRDAGGLSQASRLAAQIHG